MKKTVLALLMGVSISFNAFAQVRPVDFYQVYQAAIRNDQIFKQALANRDIAEQDVPQAIAVLLPQIDFVGTGSAQKVDIKGDGIFNNRTGELSDGVDDVNKTNALGFQVTLTQVVFNFTNWMQLAAASDSVKSAYATFTAAIQSLIQRTATAYFNVLEAEDNLRFAGSEKRAFYRQYLQAKESYEVGVKTITDMYNAKAAYDTSTADYIAAENNLNDEKEALRVITGHYYNHLMPLKYLPLIKPRPANIDSWSRKAEQNSWEIKAGIYAMIAAHKSIKAAFGGHLPTVDLSGTFSNVYTKNIGIPGRYRTKNYQADLDLSVPIFSGGEVTSQVKQAIAEYDLASSQLEQTHRDVINQTRTSYLGAISGISQVKADEQSVISNRSSLEGNEQGYKVGTRTIVDVLNAENNLYDSERQLATDRYAYILSLIDLKQAAGILNVADVQKVNSWLGLPSMLDTDAKKYAEQQAKLDADLNMDADLSSEPGSVPGSSVTPKAPSDATLDHRKKSIHHVQHHAVKPKQVKS